MKTPASIGSHPIHPMLIPFPLALWTFSLISDAIFYFGGRNPAWENVAFYCLSGGIVGGALAAVPGIIDYFSIKDKEVSNIAAWHARINVLALLIFIASFYLRTDKGLRLVGHLTIPVLLSVLGVILISISGYLGGEMVYVHHVAVGPQEDANAELRAPGGLA